MSEKGNSNPYSQILVTVVITILVGSTSPWWWGEVKELFGKDDTQKELIETPEGSGRTEADEKEEDSVHPKCESPWRWDPNSEKCIKTETLNAKTFSIPLESSITTIDGRIDFYTNRERLPGVNAQGQVQYRPNIGVVQVVIPIMKGTRMVGEAREVIYSTNQGRILKVSSLPETTGWLRRMQVAYSLQLSTDCNKTRSICKTNLLQSGKRVQLSTKEMKITIAKNPNSS